MFRSCVIKQILLLKPCAIIMTDQLHIIAIQYWTRRLRKSSLWEILMRRLNKNSFVCIYSLRWHRMVKWSVQKLWWDGSIQNADWSSRVTLLKFLSEQDLFTVLIDLYGSLLYNNWQSGRKRDVMSYTYL